MVGAARLEQLILEAIAIVSSDEWVQNSIGGWLARIGSLEHGADGTSFTALVEAMIALESADQISIRKYQGLTPIAIPYSRAESQQATYRSAYFLRGAFDLRLTHGGRKALGEVQPIPAGSNSPTIASDDRMPPDAYRLHAEIEKVSGSLYRDSHYKQAALEAYIRVIEEVKRRSGIADDGDSLMNRAFVCDKQPPVIQFNTLQTEAERDEQKGLMFLFKGIVGLRNSKAHSNTLFDDPHRAHEYLALASLLLRLLEIAKVNSAP